jgi:calcineurin-like phosphoesterase family protein
MVRFDSLNKFDQLWLTSDTHYAHNNICRGTTRWDLSQHGGDNSVRDFDTLEEMNDTIIKGINENVKENDVLMHAGDVAFGGAHRILEFAERVNCKNIILTYGNHDHNIRTKGLHKHYFENVLPAADTQYIQFKGNNIVVNHYPMAIWHQGHKGAFHAFGHVHGSYAGLGKSFDVGIDNVYNAIGEYRPITIDEFLDFCNIREAFLDSHHNRNTN